MPDINNLASQIIRQNGSPFITDSGKYITDCVMGPIAASAQLDRRLAARWTAGIAAIESGRSLELTEIG